MIWPSSFYEAEPPPFAFSGRGWLDAGFFSQQWQHLFHERVGGDAMFLSQDRNGAVLDKLIGPSDAHNRRIDHF